MDNLKSEIPVELKEEIRSMIILFTKTIQEETIKKIVEFINNRAEELSNVGGVHIRESVALYEVAVMIENDTWKENVS